jgi:Ca2+-binding RTX toxin-like protein
MTNDISDPNANNLIGLWDFLDDGETEDSGLADNTAQNGDLEGGADISGGQLHTDGSHDYFDVETSGNSDAPFNLSEGTVAVQFTQSDHIGWSPDVVVNRGEYDDRDDEGWFGLSVTHDGKVTVDHADNGQSAHLSTEAGFFNEHDKINATYAWSETDGLTLHVQNLTQGTETTVTSSKTGLTMDVTDNDDESWTFGAREEDDGDYDQFFKGAIDYVAVYDKDIVNNGPDGAVDGEETGEDMALGYDDANAPTDGGGDVITNDADLIFGNGGDDTINGAAGNDTIFGDSGFGTAGSVSMVRESFEWDKIDDTDGGSGAVDNGDPLNGGVTQNTGNVDVTFSVVNATSQVRTEFADNQQKVHSITDDGDGVDAHSSMASELDGDYANATYAFDFSKEVENVSFRINDIDGDGLVKVYAYDAEDNPVELDIDAGADLHASNQDGVDGTEVLDSEGGYEHDTSPNHSALINIAGPVARIDVQHIENGPDNSGINITDMYYDAPVGAVDDGAAGNDSLLGDDGDDVLYGEGGDDTLEGGAGSDLMYGDSPDAAGTAATGSITITGQNGDYNGALLVEIRDGETGDVKDTITLTDDYDGNIGESYDIPLEDGDTFRVGITSPEGTFYSDSENALSTTTSPDGSVSLAFEDTSDLGDQDFDDVTVDVDFAGTGAMLLTDGGSVTASAPTEEGDGVPAGNDDLTGGEGDDTLFGNGADDALAGGEGDDLIYGDNGAPVGGPDNNLIANGSFEDTSGMAETGYGYVSTGSIPGWTTDDPATEVDVHDDDRGGMVPTDGENWLDLEASPGNIRIGQDVQGVVDGAEYQLNFDVSDSQDLTSNDGSDENTVNVYWGGELIDTIDPSNVDESDFETISLTLTGGSGDGSNRLEFEGTGQEDDLGAAIDNVQLFALDPAVGNSAEGGDDTIIGDAGADTMVGEGGNDTFIISDSADADGDLVIGGNGPDDTTDEDVLDLRGTGQVTIADAADANDDGARAGTVTFADGSTLEFSQIETILTDPQNDGIVDGANDGETMELGYTDPQGDQITTGDDSIRGNDGDDMIDGDAGNDTIDGGAGDDEVTGAAGTDSVDGGDGSDTLAGGDGTDTLNGDAGDDDIAVGGSDSATGGTGDDVFTIDTTDPAPDIDATIDGGSDGTDGNPDGPENGDEGDSLDLSDRSEDLTVVLEDADPESGTVDGLDADNASDVTFDEIEKIVTGSGDDTVDGDGVSGPIDVVTGAGKDSVDGGDQGDTIDTGPGNDTVNSGDGADTVDGGEGDNLIDTSGDGLPLLDDKNGDGDGFAAYGSLPAAPADPDENDDRDVVTTGSGNDTILTGDDDDTITAAGGDNSIDAGIDDDDITTGDGSDTIVGGEGSDTVLSGGGDDRIFGGLNPDDVPVDELNIPDAPDGGTSGPDPDEENGRDLIDAGAGNDTVFGQDDDDTMSGGAGNDVLDGGVDDDTISGDAGDDTIIGGQGADTMSGGAGSDVFQIDSREDAFGDVIDGGTEDGDGDPSTDNENDQLDLRDLGRFEIVQSDGTTPLDLTSPNDPDGNSFSGEVNFIAADGTLDGTLEFNEIENVIPCFTPGTVIATPKGERLVEDLEVGDRVITRDNGLQEIRWVGRRNLSGQELLSAPHLKPVLIRAGSLGRGLPERDMMVSPQHRLLINNERSALYFEEREVLAAAKHLTGIEGVDSVEASGVSYIHFMFDQHEVVLSNGSWTESFQPGEQTLDGMGEAQKSELFGLFPELQESEGVQAYESARRSLKKHEARLLVK